MRAKRARVRPNADRRTRLPRPVPARRWDRAMSRVWYWHGGAPGLRTGDLILPGHQRKHHDGCPWCEARARQAEGGAASPIDPLAEHPDMVYATTHKLYAKHFASLYGYGSLYRVEPVGAVQRSPEDTVPTWMAPAWRVLATVDRMVLLTWSERRRLFREWGEYDAAAHASDGPVET